MSPKPQSYIEKTLHGMSTPLAVIILSKGKYVHVQCRLKKP